MKKYLPRLIEQNIEEQLAIMGGLVIEGPKWSGKSTTGLRYAKTIIKLQDPIVFNRYQIYASTDKNLLLKGEKPIMFDEWQKIPELWDFIRMDIDDAQYRGAYILTGSAKPLMDIQRHTGTGRLVKLKMRPMSLYEMQISTGTVSLMALFNHEIIGVKESKIDITFLSELICRGGWPGSLDLDAQQAIKVVENYYHTLTSEDIVDVDQIRKDQKRAKLILRSFSRHISTLTPYQTMIRDIIQHGDTISDETFRSYINAFEKLYIIDNVPAWSPKLRSKTTIRTTDKRQLIDPSLAAVALGAKPQDLMNDFETFGLLFESLCFRDLAIYIESLGGHVSHYRDSNQLEVDMILHLPDGRWGAVEIKMGLNELDKATKNLLKLKEKVDVEKAPSFLMILTATDLAYKTKDDIYIVPLGILKP